MILDDGADTRLELHILGYQYPDLAEHDDDSNWLVIQLRLDTPTDSWTRSAPCALTGEMEHPSQHRTDLLTVFDRFK